MEFVKIRRERAVDAVYEALRQAIVSCSLKPGERLNVEELATKMGVSLTPVRGAIQQLATEGLVEVRPRSGTFVASLTPQDLEDTFKLRSALECLAAEEAVERIQPQQLRRLNELLRLLKRKVSNEEERRAHEQGNSEFHQIFIDAAGNQRLADMYHALNAHIKIVRVHAGESGWPTRMQEEQAEHEAIVAALEAKDVPALTGALRKHIYRAKDAMIAALKALDGEQPEAGRARSHTKV
ncbi:GntR family transcriptional regulator [uncultured Paludibaculum sp.]|uniref:GntR family transcriptional regulator n=1 Tax=uncultured Paludibaculum sp. TaxID=1765020 RepID=UPI002AAB278C|nr:GntR family transcriptional regulator [uncultured Paludibaculum sp.]